jgi:predicted Ser/Thr protein kinase
MEIKFNIDLNIDQMIDKPAIEKRLKLQLEQSIDNSFYAFFYERDAYINSKLVKDKGIGRSMIEEMISKELEKPEMQDFIKSKIDKMMDEQIENICAAKLKHMGKKMAFTTDHQIPKAENV